jgi:hypothetical protein
MMDKNKRSTLRYAHCCRRRAMLAAAPSKLSEIK